MFEKLWQSPVLLGIAAALLYGVGGPVMKIAGQSGASANGILLMYGLGAVVVALGTSGSNAIAYATPQGFVAAVGVGLMFGLAFKCIAQAFSLPGGLITVVLGVTASYPLFSSIIELTMMGQAKNVNVGYAVFGVLLVISGGYLLSLCVRH